MGAAEIELWMKERGIVALNIHCDGDKFIVHHRRADEGFVCAQRRHFSIESALREHISPSLDADGLLV